MPDCEGDKDRVLVPLGRCLGVRASGSEFGLDFGLRVLGSGCRAEGFGFRGSGVGWEGFGLQGISFRA